MTRILANTVMLALAVGLIESGFDATGVAGDDESAGVAHEIHSHLGADDELPEGDRADVEHFCHCVTHGAALAFSIDTSVVSGESIAVTFNSNSYRSLAIPPPVPPPNA